MNRVFVLSKNKQQLMPCTAARARILLKDKSAKIYKFKPFTIIMRRSTGLVVQDMAIKHDPGSKTTGIAVVAEFERGKTLVFGANLSHKQTIKSDLDSRHSYRRARRTNKLRYRAPRFDNRTRREGWLPPSVQSRVDNITNWTIKLIRLSPISTLSVETVRFDMQKMMNPEISGVEYQQGELMGYEMREYLLEKFNRTCMYCDTRGVPLDVEHIIAKANGGSNKVSNLGIACRPCNQKKGANPLEVFVKDTKKLAAIKAKLKSSLKDAAAVNASRNTVKHELFSFGLPVEVAAGSRTKMNRVKQGYPKDHFIDAACVGESGESVAIKKGFKPLLIQAVGWGNRQFCRTDKFGIPLFNSPKSKHPVHPIRTGDLVKVTQKKR